MTTSGSELSQEHVFTILQSPRRRYVFSYLRQQGGSVELSDLIDQVAAWENDTTPAAVTREQRKRVYISLYQTHLPKLDDTELIDYEHDAGEVHLLDRAQELDIYLGECSPTFPWDRYYLVLSLVSLLLVGGAWFDISLLSLFSGMMAATLIVIVYGLSAIVQYLSYHRM